MDRAVAEALRDQIKVYSEAVVVDPDVARDYLGRGGRNRRLNRARVTRYARDMVDNRWEINGEHLIFGEDGSLQNGQHRLNAVIEADTAVVMLVTHNVKVSAFATMDSGLTRSSNDVLRMSDVPNSTLVSPVVRILLNYRDSMPWSTQRSASEIKEALILHPKIVDYVERNKAAIKIGKAGLGAVLLIAEHFGPTQDVPRIIEFANGVATGEGLTGTDSRLHYRNRIMSPAGRQALIASQPTSWTWARYALEHYLDGSKLRKFVPPTPGFADLRAAPKYEVQKRWDDQA